MQQIRNCFPEAQKYTNIYMKRKDNVLKENVKKLKKQIWVCVSFYEQIRWYRPDCNRLFLVTTGHIACCPRRIRVYQPISRLNYTFKARNVIFLTKRYLALQTEEMFTFLRSTKVINYPQNVNFIKTVDANIVHMKKLDLHFIIVNHHTS